MRDISGTFTIQDRQFLQHGAREFGVILSEKQLSLFSLFLEGLWLWNKRINLTGIREKREIIIKLLLDSLAALPHLASTGTLLDIGSGAGIPGIPLKIGRSAFEVHLLESKAKKISFLRDMIRKLDLKGIQAYKGRADKKADSQTPLPLYESVTARALAPLPKLISICSPYVQPGGLLIAFKGSGTDHEIEESRQFMKDFDLNISKTVSYYLPETNGKRHLLILQKGGA